MGVRPLHLRRVEPGAPGAQALLQRWRRAGLDVRMGSPAPERAYLHIVSHSPAGAWQGLIDARRWLHGTLAPLARVLHPELHLEAAQALFDAMPRPLGTAPLELAQDTLLPVSLAPPSATAPMPCLALGCGELWLSSLPPGGNAAPPAWVRHVPLPLRLVLGRSQLPRVCLDGWAVGDVLVQTRRTSELWLADRQLGCFSLTAEGFQMLTTPPQSPSDALPDETEALPPGTLDELSVSLEFILQRRTLTLAQLAELQAGQVLALPADSHLGVRLEVAGQVLGYGELVQLDGHLGVELRHVGGGSADE